MAVVIFRDLQTAQQMLAEMESTPTIEGGAGSVRLGPGVAGADGRVVISHPFLEVEKDWIEAYAAEVGVEVHEELPPGWRWP